MALALGGLLGDQLAARREDAVLGSGLQGIEVRRRSRGSTAVRELVGGLARLQAADETLQPLLLLVVELGHACLRQRGPARGAGRRGIPARRRGSGRTRRRSRARADGAAAPGAPSGSRRWWPTDRWSSSPRDPTAARLRRR